MKETILISLVVIFIYIFLFLNRQNVSYIESYDGNKYMVYKDNDMKAKADILGKILNNMMKLKAYLVSNISIFPEYSTYIKQLDTNLRESKTIVYETEPSSDLTSYSVNKGEEISFCLKSKKTGTMHDINLLTYVAIHEMAHIACPEIGHGDLFKKIFAKFAEVAIKIGIYNRVDYGSSPVEYCGMMLSSSII